MRLMCLTGMKYADLMSWSSLSVFLCFDSLVLCSALAVLYCDASVSKYHTWNITIVGKKWQFLSTNCGKMSLFSVDSMRLNPMSTCMCSRVAKGTQPLSKPFIWCFEHRHSVYVRLCKNTTQIWMYTFKTMLRRKDCSVAQQTPETDKCMPGSFYMISINFYPTHHVACTVHVHTHTHIRLFSHSVCMSHTNYCNISIALPTNSNSNSPLLTHNVTFD